MNLKRVRLLIRRFLRARSFGVTFLGTTGFQMPEVVHWHGRSVQLSAPPEVGAALDFINCWLDDEYGLRDLPFSPKTILDIGANFGLFSLLAAYHYQDAEIHAYEPNPRVVPHLMKNFSLIKGSAFETAVGSQSGLATMCEFGDSRLAQTRFSERGNVQIAAFQTVIERLGRNVDLLKLDCEGAEWDIFKCIDAFQNVRVIRMEYHLTESRRLEDLQSWARQAGFEIQKLLPNSGFGIAWLARQGG